MNQRAKVLATKPDNPSPIPRLHRAAEGYSCKLSSTHTHTHTHTHVEEKNHTHTRGGKKYFGKKSRKWVFKLCSSKLGICRTVQGHHQGTGDSSISPFLATFHLC